MKPTVTTSNYLGQHAASATRDGEQPLAIIDAMLDFEIAIGVITWCDPPDVLLLVQPRVQGFHATQDDDERIFDVLALAASTCRPGAHWIITCSCGYPDDTAIEAPIFVDHPDEESITWELDLAAHGVLLEGQLGNQGHMRLRFQRRQYEDAVRRLVDELKHWMTNPAPLHALQALRAGQLGRNIGGAALQFGVDSFPISESVTDDHAACGGSERALYEVTIGNREPVSVDALNRQRQSCRSIGQAL